ncbi:DUF5673 domain-containing protein [Bacillus marinisedimentorum]|uniref:DUF5673 domain-containing protein n=1 Tax=Bacillus marinisedimentorum TaxID=1821260 RepID=UPI0008732466|nr:DUF5673 domain-containing protein [Bacillus marinisedimentorum]
MDWTVMVVYTALFLFAVNFSLVVYHFFRQKGFGDILYPYGHVFQTEFGSIVIKSTNTWQYRTAVVLAAIFVLGAAAGMFLLPVSNHLLFLFPMGMLYSFTLVLLFNVMEIRTKGLTINGFTIPWEDISSYRWNGSGLHYRLCVYHKQAFFTRKHQTMLIPKAEKEKIEALITEKLEIGESKGLPV